MSKPKSQSPLKALELISKMDDRPAMGGGVANSPWTVAHLVEMIERMSPRIEQLQQAFELTGHPHAKRCYAWSYMEQAEPKYVTVLEIPPVDSAERAVKIAIAASSKQGGWEQAGRPYRE